MYISIKLPKMDLQQRKLTKSEWDSIEKPISSNEKEILKLIIDGYEKVGIKYNKQHTILGYLKMEQTSHLDDYVLSRYLLPQIINLRETCVIPDTEEFAFLKIYKEGWKPKHAFKKSLSIKLQRYTPAMIEEQHLMESKILDLIKNMLSNKFGVQNKKKKLHNSVTPTTSLLWCKQYITLKKLLGISLKPNKHICDIANKLLCVLEEEVDIPHIIEKSADYIEQNIDILKYQDISLYRHQKEIFTHVKNDSAKLIMYTAPTGTGKTLTPIGLLNKHKVIFVCAARHVGLALAKSAINMQKKVAFAFGCESADDIRLHYFAAKDYTKDWRTGGIRKVDNSVGDKVELMICDVKSYLPAMYYMLAFNVKQEIITYWDEPTITMDYETHECHTIIQDNWSKNLIPNIVLSSATLPKMHELTDTIADFRSKFYENDPTIINILSSDCRKSVPIVNKYGYVVSPHNISNDYNAMKQIVTHCQENPVLMRYFDLNDISSAIIIANNGKYTTRQIDRKFASVEDVTMQDIKDYYLDMLSHIKPDKWNDFYIKTYNARNAVVTNIPPQGDSLRKVKSMGNTPSMVNSVFTPLHAGKAIERTISVQTTTKPDEVVGTYISTKDSHTLTDGPTIYLSNEPEKIAKFCIQQANIPEIVMTDLLQSIEFNNNINEKIERLENELEDALPKESGKSDDKGKGKSKTPDNSKKIERTMEGNTNVAGRIREKLDTYRSMIKVTQLNETFVPNKRAHVEKWAYGKNLNNVFTSTIGEDIIVRIMSLSDVSNAYKILLMLGIGVFTNHKSVDYTEIMKHLADTQRLYLIIASSDYIYGTNFQFCHGYISKNMGLTQEKTIQAIGRVGRSGVQQKYTIRFRDDEPIHKLFTHEENKPEVINMNRLFTTTL